MTPTALFELLKTSQDDFDTEKVLKFKRLDSGGIEMELKSGNKAVFRINPNDKQKYLLIEWR